jgi:hypothetical protein
MPADDCEHPSMFIGDQTADRPVGEFLMDHLASEAE